MQQVISVWVRDPRIRKNDFWHAYIDYEICLHVSKMIKGKCFNLYIEIEEFTVICLSHCVLFQTDSVCFTKKISSVRRRYSEFVWLRQKLQANSMLM